VQSISLLSIVFIPIPPTNKVWGVYRNHPNLSGFKIADRYLLWPVPKLKIDLNRRNASTQGRKTDLVESYQHYTIAFFELIERAF
jgi:hypothetical protein